MPSLEFTLMAGCPLNCAICPQDSLRAEYGKNAKYMSLENFKTILGKVPQHVRVDFSGMAEPWANPDATAMLAHTLQSGYSVAIYTTLYGMTPDDCPVVVDLLRRHANQIEVLCLHLPDRNGHMRGWRYSAEYEANLRNFLNLRLSGFLRNFQVMTMDRSGKPHKDLDHLNIKLGAWVGHTRAGNVGENPDPKNTIVKMPEHHNAVSCSYTHFYDQNVCLPNGDVVLCCMDYSLKHKVGNLLEQDYYEMFASGGLAPLISENMNPLFSRKSLCKTCDRASPYTVGPAKQMWQAAS